MSKVIDLNAMKPKAAARLLFSRMFYELKRTEPTIPIASSATWIIEEIHERISRRQPMIFQFGTWAEMFEAVVKAQSNGRVNDRIGEGLFIVLGFVGEVAQSVDHVTISIEHMLMQFVSNYTGKYNLVRIKQGKDQDSLTVTKNGTARLSLSGSVKLGGKMKDCDSIAQDVLGWHYIVNMPDLPNRRART